MALLCLVAASAFVLPAISVSSPAQAPLYASPEAVGSHGPSLEVARDNAPHIFNAIHSSIRQWGSSLNHNGMSLFPARIPNNTQLYHGTHMPDAVKGMEWLAFEIEHAEMFARTFPNRPRPPSGPPGDPERPPPGKPGGGGPPPPGPPLELSWAETVQEIRRRDDDDDDMPDFSKGYLHIYRTTRPLTKLVYIDGMSAGKTEMGTLDMQDLVLRNNTADDDKPAWSDGVRGKELCELGAEWGIEGFVRMEMGFEIIFCEFSDGLVLESARQRPNTTFEAGSDFETLRGASMRYPGITSQRLRLDYSGMVSAYWYDLNMTNPDPKRQDLPRLPASDLEAHRRIKADFKAAFEESSSKADVGNDWQGITDMIITRYSDRLQLMARNETRRETLLTEVAVLLNVYVDWGDFDVPTAMDKCSAHYLIPAVLATAADHLIHEALLAITNKICSTLFYVGQLLLEDENDNDQEKAKSAVRTLIEYLDWTTWKECGKCAPDQFCFVAIWPWGAMEDHEHPSCMGNEKMASRYGYWNMGGPPRGPPPNGTRPPFDTEQ